MQLPSQELLAHLPMFRGLTPPQREEIAGLLRAVPHTLGGFLTEEGGVGDCMFVLESGEVEVLKRNEKGELSLLAVIKGPDVMGEMALLSGAKRSASLRPKGHVFLFRIDRADFDALRAQRSAAVYQVIFNLAERLCTRLDETSQKVDALLGTASAGLLAKQGAAESPTSGTATGGRVA